MTMPTHQYLWRTQVHHIHQETPDAWIIPLLCHDYYPYRAGQYALVSVCNPVNALRVYTISSTPGVSEYTMLTTRRIDDGAGSQWLTRDVKCGDYIWLSDAMGGFTCEDKAEDKFLMLATGHGVTPITSARRWLAEYRSQADVQVIFNVRSPQDVTLADERCEYPATLVAENNATEGFVSGRLMTELLKSVPDLISRTVMTCGLALYMDLVEKEVKALDMTCFFKEQFFISVAETATSGLKFTKLQPVKESYAPVGSMSLEALESNKVPVVATCRAGVCDCCKAKAIDGNCTVSSTMTLTDAEVAEGYVLVCSCHPQGGLVLA